MNVQIVPINWAPADGFWTRLKASFTKVPDVWVNTIRTIMPYDQKKNPYCTAFGSAGMYTYNRGKKFTNEQISAWFETFSKSSKPAWVTTKRFAEWVGARWLSFSLKDKNVQLLLQAGYAIGVSTLCPAEFWADGIRDGVVNQKNYEQNEMMGHFLFLIRKWGKDYLVNSWGKYETEYGMYNTYEVDVQNMIDRWLIRDTCFFIF